MFFLLRKVKKSFNPCFDGSGSEIQRISSSFSINSGFNPCFDGSGSEIAE